MLPAVPHSCSALPLSFIQANSWTCVASEKGRGGWKRKTAVRSNSSRVSPVQILLTQGIKMKRNENTRICLFSPQPTSTAHRNSSSLHDRPQSLHGCACMYPHVSMCAHVWLCVCVRVCKGSGELPRERPPSDSRTVGVPVTDPQRRSPLLCQMPGHGPSGCPACQRTQGCRQQGSTVGEAGGHVTRCHGACGALPELEDGPLAWPRPTCQLRLYLERNGGPSQNSQEG